MIHFLSPAISITVMVFGFTGQIPWFFKHARTRLNDVVAKNPPTYMGAISFVGEGSKVSSMGKLLARGRS